MNKKQIIAINALIVLAGATCWGERGPDRSSTALENAILKNDKNEVSVLLNEVDIVDNINKPIGNALTREVGGSTSYLSLAIRQVLANNYDKKVVQMLLDAGADIYDLPTTERQHLLKWKQDG